MKLQTWAVIGLLGTGLAASGALYTEGPYASGFTLGTGNIPDGNPNGWWDTRNVSDIPSGLIIGGVTVTFTISGGYNGDLYGYLSHNGVLVPLLNRVGMGTGSEPTFSFGYATSGFNNITLADGAANGSIHNVENPISGQSYQPDGGTLGGITGDPNGNWTIFFADLSGGGGQSSMVSWSLDITAVPEPVNVALGIFGGLVLLGGLCRTKPVRDRLHRCWAGINQWLDAV
jgi:hypothetical protein